MAQIPTVTNDQRGITAKLCFGVFLTGYAGIAISLWPYIIPFKLSFRQAAAAPESQSLLRWEP
jgi:cytochrome bd-type quinol oxidase subunit 2